MLSGINENCLVFNVTAAAGSIVWGLGERNNKIFIGLVQHLQKSAYWLNCDLKKHNSLLRKRFTFFLQQKPTVFCKIHEWERGRIEPCYRNN